MKKCLKNTLQCQSIKTGYRVVLALAPTRTPRVADRAYLETIRATDCLRPFPCSGSSQKQPTREGRLTDALSADYTTLGTLCKFIDLCVPSELPCDSCCLPACWGWRQSTHRRKQRETRSQTTATSIHSAPQAAETFSPDDDGSLLLAGCPLDTRHGTYV